MPCLCLPCGARTPCGVCTSRSAAPAPPAATAPQCLRRPHLLRRLHMHPNQCLRRSRTPCGACTTIPAAFAPPAAPAPKFSEGRAERPRSAGLAAVVKVFSYLTRVRQMRERVLFSTTHLGGQYAGVPHWVPVVACDTDKIVQDRSFYGMAPATVSGYRLGDRCYA